MKKERTILINSGNNNEKRDIFESKEWLEHLMQADEVEYDELRKEAFWNLPRSFKSVSPGAYPSHKYSLGSDLSNTRSSSLSDASSNALISGVSRSQSSYLEQEAYVNALATLLVPKQEEELTTQEKVERWCDQLFHNFYYQSFQVFIALLSCGFYIHETYGYYEELEWGISKATYIKDVSVTAIFLVDYIIGIVAAQNKWRHLFRWATLFDLLSILPGILLVFSDRTFLEFFILCRLVRASYILRLHRFTNIAETSRKGGANQAHHDYFAMTADEQALNFTRHALSLILTVVCIVFVATGVVFYLQVRSYEHAFIDSGKTKDHHLYFHEALYFVIITLATIGFGDVIPVTSESRMVMSVFVVLFLTFVPYFSVELISSMHEYSHYLGRYWVSKRTRHILLTGSITFENVDTFLTELHELHGAKNIKVVILAPTEPDFRLLAVIRSARFKSKTVYLKGSPLNASDLDRAAARSASAIIMLTQRVYKHPKQEDAKLLYQVMSVASYLGPPEERPHVEVVVGVNRPQCIGQVRALGVPLVVSRDLTKLACVSHSILSPGLSALVSNLIKSPEIKTASLLNAAWYAEYYRGASKQIYMTQFSQAFRNMAFSEAVAKVYQLFELILIGVQSVESHKVILNPGQRYKIQEGDQAFLIAYSQKEAMEVQNHKGASLKKKQNAWSPRTRDQKIILQSSMQSGAYGALLESKAFQKEQQNEILQLCRLTKNTKCAPSVQQHCMKYISPQNIGKEIPQVKKSKEGNNAEKWGKDSQLPLDALTKISQADLDDLGGFELKQLLKTLKNERLQHGHMSGEKKVDDALSSLIKLDVDQMTASESRSMAVGLKRLTTVSKEMIEYYLVAGSEFHLQSADLLSNHAVVVGFPLVPTHMEYFLRPLSGKTKVVFLVRYKNKETLESCLSEIKNNNQIPLDGVFYVVGSPVSRRRLLQAGVDRCSSLTILSSKGATAESSDHGTDQEHADADVLMTFLKIKELVREDCHLLVELVSEASLHYLNAFYQVHTGPNSLEEQSPWPLFAAGKVYATSHLSMLLAKAVFNPSIVIILEELLGIYLDESISEAVKEKGRARVVKRSPPRKVSDTSSALKSVSPPPPGQGSRRVISPKGLRLQQGPEIPNFDYSELVSIPVPEEFLHHSFGELFQELISPPLNFVAVGLYRAKGTKASTEPYVYTAPRADTVLAKNDMVFLLTNPTIAK